MKRRTDYSRMVSLDMTPTEACSLILILNHMLDVGDRFAVEDMDYAREVFGGWVKHLELQLDRLDWPQERRRAPYPV